MYENKHQIYTDYIVVLSLNVSYLPTHTQIAMIEGVHLAIHHMSTRNGGQGGVVINTASVAGDY